MKANTKLLIGVGAIMAYLAWNKYLRTPQGIRLNNPGNLRDVGIDWNGRVGGSNGFVKFDKMSNGVRALVLDLTSDFYKKGYKTVNALISHYAPSNENDTQAYINDVAGKLGIDPNAPIVDLGHYILPMVKAIIYHENGQQIADNDIATGIQQAYEYRGLA